MQAIRARLRYFAELVTVILFVAMFAAFLLQVFTRYILNDPVAWTQEFVLIAYIWIVFWCGAFLLREREHITFDMVFVSLPPGPRRVATRSRAPGARRRWVDRPVRGELSGWNGARVVPPSPGRRRTP